MKKFAGIREALVTTMFLVCALSGAAQAAEPDWSEAAAVPDTARSNVYLLGDSDLRAAIRAGRLHALNYPVTVTGILLPYEPIRNFLQIPSRDPIHKILQAISSKFVSFHDIGEMQDWLGMPTYPADEGAGPYFVPRTEGLNPEQHMGLTLVEGGHGATGFTISCAECHSANLFGRKIMGMTNRFPRANEFFVEGLKAEAHVDANLFGWATQASPADTDLYRVSRRAMAFVEAKTPIQLGLDTSLAQVALSLARRAQDAWASMIPGAPVRTEPLAKTPSESKPAVWWDVKYKNRWLSDGSVVSGNPIFTNLIWNEIGRGTDLHALSSWITQNPGVIQDLTTAVFSSEAPKFTDFFPAETIDLLSAQRGEKVFNQTCARCHGSYEKGWSQPNASALPLANQLATVAVHYHAQTPVIDVGTDPYRYRGMQSLVALNNLALSQESGVVIKPQHGYVPPPLVGIWARWPYFHNNSVPSLCAVLLRP